MTVVGAARQRLRPAVKSGLRHVAAVAGAATAGRTTPAPRVLCYHGVCDDPPDEWSVTPRQLMAHMDLVRSDFRPATLEQIVGWLRGEVELAPNSIAVTFDDGFVDVLEHAAPILAEAGVPGTAFVASGLVDGRRADRSYVPTRPIMDWCQVQALADAGWTVGSHSVDHPQLRSLESTDSRRQLAASRDELEQRLGRPVTLLAYPYGTTGTVSHRDQQLAREVGYEAAFLDMTGRLEPGVDLWALPRSKVLGTDRMMVVRGSMRGTMDIWRHIEQR